MMRTRALLAGLAALGLLLLVGCGGDTIDDPEEALDEALSELADADGVTIETTILSDVDSLVASGEGELDEDAAEALLDGALRTSFGFEDESFELAVDSGDGELLALRVPGDGDAMFVRADTDALFDAADIPEQERAEIEMGIGGFLGFVGFPTESLFEGRWIEVVGLDELDELADEEAAEADDPFAGVAEDLLEAFDELYEEHVRVEAGEDDGQLVVAIPLREAATFIEKASDAGAQATGGLATPPPDLTDVPDEEFRVDVWLDGGELSRVEVDFAQIADWDAAEADGMPDGVSQLGVAMAFSDFDGAVAAPDDAATWDLAGIMDGFEGMFGPGPEPVAPDEMDDLDDMGDMDDMGDLDDAFGDAAGDAGFAGMAADMLVGFAQQQLAGQPLDDPSTWEPGIEMVLQDPDVSVAPVTDGGALVALEVADSFDDSVACVFVDGDGVDDLRVEAGACPAP